MLFGGQSDTETDMSLPLVALAAPNLHMLSSTMLLGFRIPISAKILRIVLIIGGGGDILEHC